MQLKKSDLLSGDYTYVEVAQRLAWIKAQLNEGSGVSVNG